MEHNSTFPIKNSELNSLRDEATSYLKGIQWEQGGKAKSRNKIRRVSRGKVDFSLFDLEYEQKQAERAA